MRHIAEGTTNIPKLPADGTVSDECLNFLRECLQRDPLQRPGAKELLAHPWFTLGFGKEGSGEILELKRGEGEDDDSDSDSEDSACESDEDDGYIDIDVSGMYISQQFAKGGVAVTTNEGADSFSSEANSSGGSM